MIEKIEEKQTGNENPSTEDPGFWTPSRVRLLAMSVIFMSFLLLAGFGAVVYKLIEKTLTIDAASKSKPVQQQEKLLTATSLDADFSIHLNGFQIRHISQTGKYITLHVVKDATAELWVIDSNSKTIKQKIELKP